MIRPGSSVGGKYRILRQLGRGGMGTVYEALQSGLDRKVALKVMRADVASEAALKRFAQEARVLARLSHPHITQVIDVGAMGDGSPYLVMEFLDGRDLARELKKRGPLPVEEAVAYMHQACSAVKAAHEQNIVHRDLKPQNLFISNLEGDRCVKLLDFGVAKIVDSAESLTATSGSLGTPVYMSPEQVESAKNVDVKADVWALASVLYETLAGMPPFRRDSYAGTMAALLIDDPEPLEEQRADVPEELEQAILNALCKDPEARSGLAEFTAALEPFAPVEGRVRVAPERGSSFAPALAASSSRASQPPEDASHSAPPAVVSERPHPAVPPSPEVAADLALRSTVASQRTKAKAPQVRTYWWLVAPVAIAAALALWFINRESSPEQSRSPASASAGSLPELEIETATELAHEPDALPAPSANEARETPTPRQHNVAVTTTQPKPVQRPRRGERRVTPHSPPQQVNPAPKAEQPATPADTPGDGVPLHL